MRPSVIFGIWVFSVALLAGLGVGIYFIFRKNVEAEGAVATSTDECTDIAVGILERGGTAVDSIVTATLCQGLTVPQSAGLGGGFLAVVYTRETGKVDTLNSREVAPLKASKDMFPDDLSSREGGLAI